MLPKNVQKFNLLSVKIHAIRNKILSIESDKNNFSKFIFTCSGEQNGTISSGTDEQKNKNREKYMFFGFKKSTKSKKKYHFCCLKRKKFMKFYFGRWRLQF